MIPIHPVLRGTIAGAGLWIDPAICGEAEARRRVLIAWKPGTTVHLLSGGFLMRWPGDHRMRAEAAPGLPLQRLQDRLWALEEVKGEAPAGSLVWARGGAFLGENPGTAVEPAEWLDLRDWPTEQGQTLGLPPAPPILVPTPAVDLRTRLPNIPQPDPRMKEIQRAMQEGKKLTQTSPPKPWARGLAGSLLRTLVPDPEKPAIEKEKASVNGQKNAPATQTLPAARNPGFFAMALGGLLGLFSGPSSAPSGPPLKHDSRLLSLLSQRPTLPPATPKTPAWRKTLAQFLKSTGLYAIVEDKQEQYLQELMNSFESGNLEEALKRAIPMADGLGGASIPALGTPQARKDLSLTYGRNGAAEQINLGDGIRDRLKHHYTEAAKKLEQEGKIEQAVFVLSELLKEHGKAVALLERHNRFQLAAELAEGRGLSPDLQLRLWLQAGNQEKAILLARKNGLYGQAVAQLDRSHPELGKRLRWIWAESLANQGKLASAVQIAWGNLSLREDCLPWLQELADWEGEARSWAWLLSLRPDRLPEITGRVKQLLLQPERQEEALALASLLKANNVAGRDGLMRGLIRGIQPISNLGNDATWNPDLLLRSTLPDPKPAAPLVRSNPPTILANDRGSRKIFDLVLLASGELLIAFGEGGIEQRDKKGKIKARYDVPAHSLVVEDERGVVLALAPRGNLQVIHRIEPGRRKAVWFADLIISRWAPTFDGLLWIVGTDTELWGLDVANPQRLLWRLEFSPKILSMTRSLNALAVLTKNDETTVELWQYELPSLLLRHRSLLKEREEIFGSWMLPTSFGPICCLRYVTQEDIDLDLIETPESLKTIPELKLKDPRGTRLGLSPSGKHTVFWRFEGDGMMVTAFEVLRPKEEQVSTKTFGEIRLLGAEKVAARVQEGVLVIGDDLGRVLGFELELSVVRWDFRV